MVVWSVHDLLEISGATDIICFAEQQCPFWVSDSLKRAPFVVVRRADPIDGLIPVGVRGASRNQRFAGYLRAESVLRQIRPEQLVGSSGRSSTKRTNPALKAWVEVQQRLSNFSLTFGPTGSVGFELASGVSTVTTTSDLDLLFRAPKRLSRIVAQELVPLLKNSFCAVDAQLEAPRGAVSLAEYVEGKTPLLLRQNNGPILLDDPWSGLCCSASRMTDDP